MPCLERHLFPEKMLTFQIILGHSRAKNFVPRSPLDFNRPVPLNINNRSKDLRWLARVGMFFAKQVLVLQTIKHLLHFCENPGGKHNPPPFPSANAFASRG